MKLRYLDACNRIREDIMSGFYPFGARLKIADLAIRYNSSHMPIREALRLLNGEGLVEIEPNKGVKVRNFDKKFIENILQVRMVIEELQCRRAAENRSTAALKAIQKARLAFESAAAENDGRKLVQLNRQFHSLITEAAGNFEAWEITERHWQVMPVLWNTFGYPPSRVPAVIADHRFIEAAIIDRDSEGAAILAKAHCYKAKRDIIEHFDRYYNQQNSNEEI